MTFEESFTAWKKANPLARWRQANRKTRLSVCSRMAVSEQTVRNWEVGASRPAGGRIESMVRLGWFAAGEWEKWEGERPNE